MVDERSARRINLGGPAETVGPGFVTITATYGRSTGAITAKVVPDYAGNYQGGVFVVNCVDVIQGFCFGNVSQESLGRPPEPFVLNLVQVKDTVGGRRIMRSTEGPVVGLIDGAGRLTLSGTLRSIVAPANGPAKALEAWSSYLDPQGGRMSGSFNMRYFQIRSGTPAEQLGVATAEIRGIDRIP